jgi:hypothetical protein
MQFVLEKDCIASSALSKDNQSDPEKSLIEITCTDLDTWVFDNDIRKVGFIKADIEGAERHLIRGVKKTIQRDHPKISICTYHLPDDPEILKEILTAIDPSYKFFQSKKKLYAW